MERNNLPTPANILGQPTSKLKTTHTNGPFGKIIILLIGEIFLLLLVGISSYQLGINKNLSKQDLSFSKEPSTYPLPTPLLQATTEPVNTTADFSPSNTSGADTTTISIENTDDLKNHGYATNSTNPDIEVFIFADLTESGFSGHVLTENVTNLLAKYPQQVRIWYLHTVLQYRDNSNLRTAIATLKCLSDQQSVWQNMNNLVEQQGKSGFRYQLPDQEQYIKCITDINQSPQYFDSNVKNSQELMVKYGIQGVPTSIFVSRANPNQGIKMAGAVPAEAYTNQIQQLLAE